MKNLDDAPCQGRKSLMDHFYQVIHPGKIARSVGWGGLEHNRPGRRQPGQSQSMKTQGRETARLQK